MNLTELVGRSIPHEQLPVAIDPRLRRIACYALPAPIVAAGAQLWLAPVVAAHGPRPHFFLFAWPIVRALLSLGGHAMIAVRVDLITAGAMTALLTWTAGFTTGAIRVHYLLVAASTTSFLSVGTLMAAAALTLGNLALWVALIVALISIVAAVIIAVIAGASHS